MYKMMLSDVDDSELKTIVDTLKDGDIYIEIGVYYGHSLSRVINATKNRNIKYIGIDLFEDYQKSSDNTHEGDAANCVALYNYLSDLYPAEKIALHKGYSSDVLNSFPEIQSGHIFIDGNHTYAQSLKDFLIAKRVLKNGYISFHNCSNDRHPDTMYIAADGGPYQVVEDIKSDSDVKFITKVDKLGLFQRV